MAKETKAERTLREAMLREAETAKAKEAYPTKLMETLARAHKNNLKVVPFSSTHFLVSDDNLWEYAVELTYHYSPESDSALDELNWKLDVLEKEVREERRKYEVRSAALAKLTDEEKKLLNLK